MLVGNVATQVKEDGCGDYMVGKNWILVRGQ